MDIPQEYVARVRVIPGGCWNWTGRVVGLHNATGPLPYGMLIRNGRQWRAHRYFYELATGEVLGKLHLHHKCRNTLCVNPEHMEPLTQAEHNREHGKFRERAKALRASEHCQNGHPWAENTYLWKGVRCCRACSGETQRKRRRERGEGLKGQGSNMRAKTHCPQGHPYEGDNLSIDARGGRNCRICRQAFGLERKRRYRERLRERQDTP